MVSATFSFVVLDPKTNTFGSAVASKFCAVGSVVPHMMRGVGAFNTQHFHHRRLAEQGLLLMGTGTDPQTAIHRVLTDDDMPEHRQLLAIDARGRKGAWTGEECTATCGHVIGETCVAAGNTLAGQSVISAIVEHLDRHLDEPLGLRMIHALMAAEAEGGDSRGKQAAAVIAAPATLDVYQVNAVDLRVDDSEDPLAELMRIYTQHWQGKE